MSTLVQPAVGRWQGERSPRVLTFPSLMMAAMSVVLFLLIPREVDDPDIWWHLRNVEMQLANHDFLRADSYAYTTAGMRWLNHEWLAELPFYAAYRLCGDRGLFLVTSLTLEAIFLGVFTLCRRKAGDSRAALVATCFAVLLATVSFGPRTLLFGWLALVVELTLLDRFISGERSAERKLAWGLPLLFAIWVNTHGSWLIGLLLYVSFVASGWRSVRLGGLQWQGWSGGQKRTLVRALACSVPALFLNPYGWRLVLYPFDLAFRQRLNVGHVEEWASLDFHAARGHALLLALVLLFAAQVCRGRRWAPYELVFTAIGVYAAFTYSRFLFLAAILLAPLVARELPAGAPYDPARDRPWWNAACLLAMGALVVHHALPGTGESARESARYPVAATPFLAGFHPEGNVLNEYLWGGYLEWHARQIPVFIDSRTDIFEYKGVLLDYLHIVELHDSLRLMDKYQIRYVLFEQDTPLVYLLLHTPGWRVDYRDGTTILLERDGAQASLHG